MNGEKSLVFEGAGVARRNKRYIAWFYLLNLVFAWWGAAGFSTHAHGVLDHSLLSDKLLHGFDVAVLFEMFTRPEFGPIRSSTAPSMVFVILFLLASLLFMPGVLLGYSSDHRISRPEFFRACGRNMWRFVRLALFFLVIAGIVCGILYAIQNALVTAADKTSYERLPFFTKMVGLTVIFLVLTAIRIWFDLAQTEVVLEDQGAVRKSVRRAWRTTWRHFGRLLGTYVVIALAALAILAAGILLWNMIVPPSSVFGAFLVSQAILLLLLAMRFWQRAVAVAFFVRQALPSEIESAPVVAMASASPQQI